ncbi:MAG: dihydropteroate synthase [Lactobacillales bacterium]|nr:dihydropteroate synthase [Lactobacillales bacterium]
MFQIEKIQVMGVLNVTPDSFSDGGKYDRIDWAVQHAKEMVEAGVDIIDIGGQSTRPGYVEISAEEELKRVLPVIQEIRKLFPELSLSIDTYFYKVAKEAILAGINIINDIHGFCDERMFELLQEFPKVGAVLMHAEKETEDLVEEIQEFYEDKVSQCEKRGISLSRICFDPGVGWKNKKDTMDILKHLHHYVYPEIALLVGVSRKRIIGWLTGEKEAIDRDLGTIVTSLYLANTGQVDVLRVHDVKGMRQALHVWERLKNG